jgi:hypothetical protein
MDIELSKRYIFDFFYDKQQVTRSGGGSLKSKIRRKQLSFENITKMKNIIVTSNNDNLNKYFNTLLTRDSKLAPPPAPK